MLEASLLWYRKLQKDLDSVFFKLNVYDVCVVNIMERKQKHTVRFHVKNILSLHVDPRVNDEFGKWAQSKYGKVKDIKITRGKTHAFLGMVLYFGDSGVCHELQEEHLKDIVSLWTEKFKDRDMVLTPASLNIFEKLGGRLLNTGQK